MLRISLACVLSVFVILASNCGSSDDLSGNLSYAIGDTGPSGVGIVFYVSDGGTHGLEAAPAGWSGSADDPLAEWSNVSNLIGAAASGVAIWTGSDNTDAIIAQPGHLASAAALCRAYAGGSFSDWYLPSRDELHQMYLRRAVIGGFTNGQYWSSTEGLFPENPTLQAKTACFQEFASGTQNNGGWKNTALANAGGIPDFYGNFVRPVRKF